jgi:MFS family permease
MKLIEPDKIGFYSGVISSVFAMANLLGPLFGGIISDRTTWRWIFFIKYVHPDLSAPGYANNAVVR